MLRSVEIKSHGKFRKGLNNRVVESGWRFKKKKRKIFRLLCKENELLGEQGEMGGIPVRRLFHGWMDGWMSR